MKQKKGVIPAALSMKSWEQKVSLRRIEINQSDKVGLKLSTVSDSVTTAPCHPLVPIVLPAICLDFSRELPIF